MDERQKQIIAIVGFLLLVILIGVAIYLTFFSRDDEQFVIIDGEAVPIGQLPDIGDQIPQGIVIDPNTGLPIIIDDPSQLDAILDSLLDQGQVADQVQPDQIALGGDTQVNRLTSTDVLALNNSRFGDTRFYDADEGMFYRINEDGELELISDVIFNGVETVSWNKSGDQAILEFPDGSNIYYDFETGEQVTLPQQMTEFDFSYDGGQIAFEWYNEYDDQDNWIGVATPTGDTITFVEPIGDIGDRIQTQFSPDGRYIAMYQDSTSLDRQQVIPIGKFGENFKSFDVYGRGFESQWSPDGETMVYSVHSDATDRKPQLWVTSISGQDVGGTNTPIEVQTWAHKCSFGSGTDLYCAVPTELPDGVGWFPEFDDQYPDEFYKIDLTTGRQTKLANPVGNRNYYSASQIIVSEDESAIYFVDATTNDIFTIDLK
ncbi:MAG: hypothetical protein ACPGO5_04440 [Patescibacteria group bacterium]